MRTWVYNRVKAIVDSKFAVYASGALYNPAAPFIIVNMGLEQVPLGMTSQSRTQEIPFDIWVYDTQGTMVDNIDSACIALKNDLPTEDGFVVGGISVMKLSWEEMSQDTYDDQYKCNTRRVSFRMMTRHA